MADNRPYQKRWRDKNKARIATYSKEWRKNNPEKQKRPNRKRDPKKRKASDRKRRIKKYGISIEQYNAMLVAQDFACAVCGEDLTAKSPHIDHCHETLRIRGLLCGPCNISLGLMKENPTKIRQLAQYAEKYCSSRAEPLARHGRTVVPPSPTNGDIQ